MQTLNISKKRFASLEKYKLPSYIVNSEANLYVLPEKNKWETKLKLLKSLYFTTGESFGQKLYTINTLIDNKSIIDIPEIVFPEKIAVVNTEIVGFTMPLIESINLLEALRSHEIPNEQKVTYLKEIGELLEKMKKVRTYTHIDSFYLNDMHEGNFIIDSADNHVKVVDIDSCKINNNYIFSSKYLSRRSMINFVPKYQRHTPKSLGEGSFVPDENTDLYCYIIIILNFLYGESISMFTLEEFYNYLEYLESIGLDKELLRVFELAVSNSQNVNPYDMLDSIVPILGKSNHNTYSYVRKKTSNHLY